jgi:homoserine O-acetyltransferase/O-succinyltransferase
MRVAVLLLVLGAASNAAAQSLPAPERHDFIVKDFRFQGGESLPEIKIHYRTAGTPIRDAGGKITNGVMVLHGSSGDAGQVLAASFSEPLFGKGGPLDADRYFLIFPDNLGNGRSTKPSDGLRAKFPKYGYHDMVTLQHQLVTQGLGIDRLKLIIGISMGGMQAWMWGVRYPDAIDGLIPIAAMPVPIQGRNLLWRRILSQAIRQDPAWNNGNYDKPPQGFLSIMPMFDMLVQSPARLAGAITSYETADAHLAEVLEETLEEDDANNILYRFESSSDFNPEPDLGKIRARVLTILFEDDELNPLNLGIMERAMPKVKAGRLVVIPTGKDTEGHRTQVKAIVWREHVRRFMETIAK